jgi:hypothetical protein
MALALAILSFKLHDVTKANPPRTIGTNTPDSTQTPSWTFEPDRQEKFSNLSSNTAVKIGQVSLFTNGLKSLHSLAHDWIADRN